MRAFLVATLVLAAACSGPSMPAPKPKDQTAAGASPQAPVTSRAERMDEAALRRELAEGSDPAAAAFELANRLVAQDRFEEALAVVDTERVKAAPSPTLPILRARILYDLGRFQAAREELLPLATRAHGLLQSSLQSSPQGLPQSALVLHDLAEVERALGDIASALAHCQELRALPAADPWARGRGEQIDRLHEELVAEAKAGKRLYRSAREALALLRGADSPKVRCQALDTIALEGGSYATRGLELALADPEPAVRAHAFGIYRQAGQDFVTVLEFGLSDPAALVRGVAARSVPASAPGATVDRGVVTTLYAALVKEEDAYVCDQLHKALERATNAAVTRAGLDLAETAQRARLASAWRAVVKP